MIINTHDQLVAAGGDRIAIYYLPESMGSAHWRVCRMIDGKEIKTDLKAHWFNYGNKAFVVWHPIRKNKDKTLAEAFAWVEATFGKKEFVRNRLGEYVEREVNERFPIPPKKRI